MKHRKDKFDKGNTRSINPEIFAAKTFSLWDFKNEVRRDKEFLKETSPQIRLWASPQHCGLARVFHLAVESMSLFLSLE